MIFTPTALIIGWVLANTTIPTPIGKSDDANATTVEQTEHETSYNWAGAVLAGSDFQTVTGTFVAPEVVLPAGADMDEVYAASIWVGLDGSGKTGCTGVVMQTGLAMRVRDDTLTYKAWYQWYPNKNVAFLDMDITPGDSVTLTVSASSDSGGIAIIENNTQETSVNHTFVDQTPHLCQTGAEWIVEDFSVKKYGVTSRIPFADFGSVTFTNASAVNGNGTKFGPADSHLLDIVAGSGADRVLLTNVTVSDSSVSVIYYKRPDKVEEDSVA